MKKIIKKSINNPLSNPTNIQCEWCGAIATVHSGDDPLCDRCWEGWKIDYEKEQKIKKTKLIGITKN